jgi:hypothetical protein
VIERRAIRALFLLYSDRERAKVSSGRETEQIDWPEKLSDVLSHSTRLDAVNPRGSREQRRWLTAQLLIGLRA